jgi:hypothetical protein
MDESLKLVKLWGARLYGSVVKGVERLLPDHLTEHIFRHEELGR